MEIIALTFSTLALLFLLLTFFINVLRSYLPSSARESTMFNKATLMATHLTWALDFILRYCLIPNDNYTYISSIPIDFDWKPASSTDASGYCPVCELKVEQGEEVGELGCHHVLHRLCLETWVRYGNLTCPICRHALTPARLDADLGDGSRVFVFDVLSRVSYDSSRYWMHTDD